MNKTLTKTSFVLVFFAVASLANCTTSVPVDCKSTPDKTGITASTTSTQSHNTGKDCLGSCHTTGGSAATVWTVAGTMVDSKGSTTNAAAGSTVTVGGSSLIVDTCGNFYTAASITLPAAASTPTKLMSALAPGSCNLSGCHDGSAREFVY